MPAKPNDLVQIGERFTAKVSVVSPCSTCKNRRVDFTADGQRPCPRQVWLERFRDSEKNVIPAYLIAPGGTDKDLRNPAYIEPLKLILVWTADLQQNGGIRDSDGKVITPHILDPNFKTEYIRCNELPSLLFETEASYFQSGAYKENEQLLVFDVRPFQLSGSDEPLMIEGFAKRISLAFHFQFKTHDEDLHVSGI